MSTCGRSRGLLQKCGPWLSIHVPVDNTIAMHIHAALIGVSIFFKKSPNKVEREKWYEEIDWNFKE